MPLFIEQCICLPEQPRCLACGAVFGTDAKLKLHQQMAHSHTRGETYSNNSHRICVLGEDGVGKSALVQRLQYGRFSSYDPSIEDAYRKTLMVDDDSAMLDILDTAGRGCLTSVRDQYTRTSDGFVVAYAVNNAHSFAAAADTVCWLRDVRGPSVPVILVATKADDVQHRVVSITEGTALARKHRASYIETSSLTGHNVQSSFEALIRSIRSHQAHRTNGGGSRDNSNNSNGNNSACSYDGQDDDPSSSSSSSSSGKRKKRLSSLTPLKMVARRVFRHVVAAFDFHHHKSSSSTA